MAQITHGFFGKLPNVGDFVGRGWTAECRAGLDRLLRQALAELLNTQDPAHPFEHEVSFAISIAPGVLCAEGFVVVVIPSEDRVGRRFPLAAGVHWSIGPSTPAGWPSNDYIKALVVCARQQLVMGLETDLLQAAIARVGNPALYEPTFGDAGGDETLPRVGQETRQICVQGRLADLSPSLRALCVACDGDSEALGYRIDNAGDARDFFICRRLQDGAQLAAVFDGRWTEREWVTFGAAAGPAEGRPADPAFDADATQPHNLSIDTSGPGRDSLDRF